MISSKKNKLKRFSFSILIGSFAAAGVFAQQATQQQQNQTLAGVELKGKVPVNREMLKVSLPKAQEAMLTNGLRVKLVEDHNTPSFTMQLVILNGGTSDAPEKRGQALVTAAILREGTETRTSREISEQIDALGSQIGTSSGLATTTSNVAASGLIQNLDRTLDIFADVALHPKFPAEEIEKYKLRLLTQLQSQRTNPSYLALQQLSKVLYGDFPAANIFPPETTVKNLTAEDLSTFYKAHYRPNNAFLAVIGDVSMKQLLPKLEKAFGEWKNPVQTVEARFAELPRPVKSQIYLIDRPGSVQTSLLLGNLGIRRTSSDYYALQVMNEVLGGGAASRLFGNLREKNGYTYGAYSSFNSAKFNGTVAASADVRTNVTEGAMKEFLYEIQRIAEEKVPLIELEEAKRSIIGGFALSLDSQNALLANVIQQQIYGFPTKYWDEYPQKIAAITAEDVQSAAQKYLNPATLQIIAVGDAAKIRPVLEKFGNVQIIESK